MRSARGELHGPENGKLPAPPMLMFDRITSICAAIFKVPICLISFVDKERQWFMSKQAGAPQYASCGPPSVSPVLSVHHSHCHHHPHSLMHSSAGT